jgi:cytoskeletal protein CcmA (bactofilin family)
MAKEKEKETAQPTGQGVISIVGPGMRIKGDCDTEGTLRIEGTIEGSVRAGKAVVVGKDGIVQGDISTQDAVIGGRVTGTVTAESRLELQATCVIDGEIRARRIKLDEGGKVNGKVAMGDSAQLTRPHLAASGQPTATHPTPQAPKDPVRAMPASNIV